MTPDYTFWLGEEAEALNYIEVEFLPDFELPTIDDTVDPAQFEVE